MSFLAKRGIQYQQQVHPIEPIGENATGVPMLAMVILVLLALGAFIYDQGYQDGKRYNEKQSGYGRWME